jgi:CRISPR-associated helicase Cas3
VHRVESNLEMVSNERYRQFFRWVTGFDPSPFQERVARALFEEKSIILQAPTGSGKTWAVVVPFLYCLVHKLSIADRLLYALPLRSLATSLFQATGNAVKQCEVTKNLQDRVRIQTGERREDSLFEGVVTFTTIDQLLSSYLLHPVGLPRRCGNINAGAFLGALVCFDEFHLLEPQKSMATAIEMLLSIAVEHPLSRFVLMTATLSTETMNWLANKLGAELIDVTPEEVTALHSQQGKVRNYRWINQPLSAAHVADTHSGGRTIVIANTVSRAQSLYEELRCEVTRRDLGPDLQIRLLHSRFFPSDRQRIEQELDDWFGPHATKQNIILISTQVIEAGLDFSCDHLHTEVAPMNSIVQRAGRCARRSGESGTVWCYSLRTTATGNLAYGPYQALAPLVDNTAQALNEVVGPSARPLSFHDELDLVNRVHTKWELKQLKPLDSIAQHRESVRKAMDGEDPAAVRHLIRDVSNINIVVTDQPESLNFTRTQWPEMLSVPMTSLNALFEDRGLPEEGWIAKAAQEQDVFEGGAIQVDWVPVTSSGGIASAGWLIAIHPQYATYSSDIGLLIGRSGPAPEIRYRDRPRCDRWSYSYEIYGEHIRRVRIAGTRRDQEYQVATRRWAHLIEVTEVQVLNWLTLLYQLHDVGKLSIEWQDAIWKSQTLKLDFVPSPRPALAHSDYDPAVDRVNRRPPHAAEGAYAVSEFFRETFAASNHHQTLFLAALTAIVRHHGPFTASLGDFHLISGATQLVVESLNGNSNEIPLLDRPKPRVQQKFKDFLIRATCPEHSMALLLYLYFVRRLRIADQNSFVEE